MRKAPRAPKIDRVIKPCLFIFFCIFIQACSDIVYLHMPLNVGLPDQIAKANFVIEKEYDYRVAIQFNWQDSNDRKVTDRQNELIGRPGQKGIELPLHLTIIRNGEVFLDRVIYSHKASSLEGFCLNQTTNRGERPPSFWKDLFYGELDCESTSFRKRIWGPSRTVDIRTLTPGNYYLEVKTIIFVEEFKNMESFLEISPYSPKI